MLTAIDQIANQNHLQIFKAIIPYIPRQEQRFFSFYIKMMEVQNVTHFFDRQTMQACSAGEGSPELSDILKDIRNYCDESESKIIDQITNMMTAMELFSAMSEPMEQEDYYE
ncbi:MAG: hypothetical protein PHE06_04045 [Lachnospiraceae bacterium]|nr:hypothetical protein [Lachnospiraceae bacterium]